MRSPFDVRGLRVGFVRRVAGGTEVGVCGFRMLLVDPFVLEDGCFVVMDIFVTVFVFVFVVMAGVETDCAGVSVFSGSGTILVFVFCSGCFLASSE